MPSSSPPPPGLGKAIRQLRTERDLTQEGLAHEAATTAATISAIERGVSNPSWGTVEAIAAALDITVSELAMLSEEISA